MIAFFAVLLAGTPHPTATAAGCPDAMRIAIRTAAAGIVPQRCWRIGPLTLGMDEAAVRKVLGTPAAVDQHGDRVDLLYVVPARPGRLVVHSKAHFRQVLLRFDHHELVRFDSEVGYSATIDPRRCQAGHHRYDAIDTVPEVGPGWRFSGIGAGAITVMRQSGTMPEY